MNVLKSRIYPDRGKIEMPDAEWSPAADSQLRIKLVQRVVSWAEKNGQTDIRADRQGMVTPDPVTCDVSGLSFVPDATADKNGVGMLYAAESSKSLEDKPTARKLCAFSRHARKNVQLFVIVVPAGCGEQAKNRIEELGLDAQVLEIDI